MVKAITCSHPRFLKETYYYSNLIDHVNDDTPIKTNERFIKFNRVTNQYEVYVMTKYRVHRFHYRHESLISAVFRAK